MKNNSKVTSASKGNVIDYIKTKNWEYGDGPEPRTVVRDLPSMSKADEYNAYFNKESPKYYNRSKSRGSGTMDIAWELPSEMEEDVYGRYLELLKSGDLTPNTSFKNFEENYSNYDAKLIQKKKALDEMRLSNAIQKIDSAVSGIVSLGGGGPVKNRPKEPTVKKLNLADYFKLGMRVADLTPSERELVSELIKKSLSYNKDN